MGADGHIQIFNYDKVVDLIGEDTLEKLIDSAFYIQELEGKKYLTKYHGDYFEFDSSDWSDKYGWMKDGVPFTKKEFDDIWSKIFTCRITSWEVWT